MTPKQIRKLRGDRTREEFAARMRLSLSTIIRAEAGRGLSRQTRYALEAESCRQEVEQAQKAGGL